MRLVLGGLVLVALTPTSRDDDVASVRPLEAAGIESFYQLGDRLYSGSQPEGDEAFQALADRGIKVLISVDGARPDVEAARRHGLRYVHLPIGYDGVPPEQAARLTKAVTSLPGKVFVHCHHGKHRGPSAAAVCARVIEGWDDEQAADWLKLVGTDPAYVGLFRDVAAFRTPDQQTLDAINPAELPEVAEIPDVVARMVAIDAIWDHLKVIRAAGYRTPPDHPDLDPSHEALMLLEAFRESRRLDDAGHRGPEFDRSLAEAIDAAERFQNALGDPKSGRQETGFKAVEESCRSCHSRHRDR